MKKLLKRLVGEANLGRLDYLRHRDERRAGRGPLNGQRFRLRVFADILYAFPVRAIVETGTFRGQTTALFASLSLPVYTVEVQRRHHSYSKMRFFLSGENVSLHHGDSPSFLRKLAADDSVPKEDVFFYLDAHGGSTLPLRDELDVIFSSWSRAIVMIDDFCVPGSEYRFDDYGPGQVLDEAYIAPVVASHGLSVFFPAATAAEETGSRRGTVVLCHGTLGPELEAKVRTLVPAR